MPTYTLEELLRRMEPQARRDMALIGRCVDGLGLYAAQIASEDRFSPQVGELRLLVERLGSYWGLSVNGGIGPATGFLQAFDGRVHDAGSGGEAQGDVYQTAHNVLFGLYHYGEDMVASQGAEAMGDILAISERMKNIGAAWGFEPNVLEDLTTRLEAKVRGMLNRTPMPGEAMSGEHVNGYEIRQAVLFDNGQGFALAHNPDAPAPYVTWQFTDDGGKRDYYWGKYVGSEETARIDYITRVMEHTDTNRVQEKQVPTAAAEGRAEQNYNMIDGVRNNEGFPQPDLTDGQTYAEIRELAPETLPEEKPSVLEQIKAARQAPRQMRSDEPDKAKHKGGLEL